MPALRGPDRLHLQLQRLPFYRNIRLLVPLLSILGIIILIYSLPSLYESDKSDSLAKASSKLSAWFNAGEQVVIDYRPDAMISGIEGSIEQKGEKWVAAHFLLGNTYSYTPDDWRETLRLGYETGLDAFALNLGSEEWQVAQARTAYKFASEVGGASPHLFLSLDMNVLPSATTENMMRLVDLVEEFGRMEGQLKTTMKHQNERKKRGNLVRRIFGRNAQADAEVESKGEKVVLGTFGGHSAEFGYKGWRGFLAELRKRGIDIYFIPAFFQNPQDLIWRDDVDAPFNWNGAWPMDNSTISSSNSDQPFIHHAKPYMAAVSPWFYTHYGTTGDHPWNKNWIYRSDDNLYASRWTDILSASVNPEFVEILTWNDYGESNYIGPIMGSQPGSEAWTTGMDHSAWREMTKYFIRRYKELEDTTEDSTLSVYVTYRTQPKDIKIAADEVGRPRNADWAQDLIGVVVTLEGERTNIDSLGLTFKLQNIISSGEQKLFEVPVNLTHKGYQDFTIPFVSGKIKFGVMSKAENRMLFEDEGHEIKDGSDQTTYNFNAWTGYRKVQL